MRDSDSSKLSSESVKSFAPAASSRRSRPCRVSTFPLTAPSCHSTRWAPSPSFHPCLFSWASPTRSNAKSLPTRTGILSSPAPAWIVTGAFQPFFVHSRVCGRRGRLEISGKRLLSSMPKTVFTAPKRSVPARGSKVMCEKEAKKARLPCPQFRSSSSRTPFFATLRTTSSRIGRNGSPFGSSSPAFLNTSGGVSRKSPTETNGRPPLRVAGLPAGPPPFPFVGARHLW